MVKIKQSIVQRVKQYGSLKSKKTLHFYIKLSNQIFSKEKQ